LFTAALLPGVVLAQADPYEILMEKTAGSVQDGHEYVDMTNGGVNVTCEDDSAPYMRIIIGKTHDSYWQCDYDPSPPHEEIPVTVDSINGPINGFAFLFTYDAAAPIQFQNATPGALIDSCNWEYFTYRDVSATEDCEGCQSGLVRVVGLADISKGGVPPSCLSLPTPFTLFTLNYLVNVDYQYECMYIPIRFFWNDCGDNSVSLAARPDEDPYLSRLAVSRDVYDYVSAAPMTDPSATLPTYLGEPDACVDGSAVLIDRAIDFYNGGIDWVCADSMSACRGDLNINGVPHEIADATLFGHYFVFGDTVLTHYYVQAVNSDVNYDGIPFALADLVYLYRTINGDAPPLPQTTPTDTVVFNRIVAGFALATDTPLGAIRVRVKGQIVPTLLNDNLQMAYDYHDGYTSILIQPGELFTGAIGQGDLFAIGSLEPDVTIEAATYDAAPLVSVIQTVTGVGDQPDKLPTEFAIGQNFPNPFNLETVIPFGLPKNSIVEFEIYNVLGKLVYSHSGRYAAGEHQISWDGRNNSGQIVASGIYYYRITAGEQAQTKKMLLLK